MADSELEQYVLDLVRQQHYKPAKPRALAKKLGLDEEQTRLLKRAIKRLVKQGRLAFGANHLVRPGAPAGTISSGAVGGAVHGSASSITGLFRRNQAGHGFVRPAGAAPGTDRRHDVYIAAKDSRDASTGDTVLVRLKKKRHGAGLNPEGAIEEILERQTHRFVGMYFEAAGTAFVKIDGKTFSQPVLLGDPGAKNAQLDDKIVVEMVRFPSQVDGGEAVIVEVLGPRGAAGVDTLSIMREFDLPDEFREDTVRESRDAADAFDESIGPDRRDLSDTTIITIDPLDARDFDDAISLERHDNGHWRLGVHIADVSHFVRPKTALDREAHARGTSVYLPDRVLPMLPEIISNGLASLQPDRLRYTKSVFIEFSPEGIPLAVDATSAAIKSCRRFAYEEVDDYLADPEGWRDKLTPPVHRLLADMRDLAALLRSRRFEHGSLELSMPEVKVDLDREGQVCGAHVVANTESHQMIEAFMLAANEAVAELLAKAGLPFLRRAHGEPDPRKLKALTEFVRTLGFEVESLESRFELQKLLGKVAKEPQRHAVNYALLRSLQRAIYSPAEEGHYALASECYCHFTSPIRRYPDLTIHRLLDALLTGKKPRAHFSELVVLGEHCSDRERRAEAAERELKKIKLLAYLSGRVGEQMDAVVTGVEEFGFFVQGTDLPAEGLVHVSSLQDDFYRFDRPTHSLAGLRSGNGYRLGDAVRVVVARVDVDRRELDFRVVARGAGDGENQAGQAGIAERPRQRPAAAKRTARPSGAPQRGPAKHAKKGRRRK